MQLIIVDFVRVITYTPLSVLGAAKGQWVIGSQLCEISNTNFVFIYQLRSWLMFVFVCDRFFNVFVPFRYPKYRKKIIWSIYATVLIINTVFVVVLWLLHCSSFDRIFWICITRSNQECSNRDYCTLYGIVENISGITFGNVIPIVMYTALFIKAKKVRNQIIPVANTQVDSEQRKRDRRANLTFFTIFMSLIGVLLVPVATYSLNNFILIPLRVKPPKPLQILSYILQQLGLILPIADSIAVLRNPEMRKAINMLKTRLRAWRERNNNNVINS